MRQKSMIRRMAAAGLFLAAFGMSLILSKQDVQAATYQEWEYSVSNDKITITKCESLRTNVTVPGEINGKPVVALGDSVFLNNKKIVSVTIPASVTRIGGGDGMVTDALRAAIP